MKSRTVPLLLLAGCVVDDDVAELAPLESHHDARGQLVAVVPLRTLSAAEVRAELTGAAFEATAVRHGVDTYQLTYRTIDPAGRPTTATGLVALPHTRDRALRAVSYTHGTEVARSDAPSTQEACRASGACPSDGWAFAPALTYASAGFAALAPDYLGMGDGPGLHPWMDIPSETSAALDLVRAARRFAQQRGRLLERDVLVTGFSQGALAALGLARALDAHEDPWFRLGAVAPISGPYDWHAWITSALGGEVPPLAASFYLSYLLVAWNRIHSIYRSPFEIFVADHAAGVEALFDGDHTGLDVVMGIGPSPAEQLTPTAIARLQHPIGALADAIAVADGTCTGWSPRAPVRLVWARGDHEAPGAVATVTCRAALRASGSDAELVDLGELDHLATNRAGTAAVVQWFAARR